MPKRKSDQENESPSKTPKRNNHSSPKSSIEEVSKRTGSHSILVCDFPVKICQVLRPILHSKKLGYAFPFSFRVEDESLHLIRNTEFPELALTKNYFMDSTPVLPSNKSSSKEEIEYAMNHNIPVIKKKIGEETSQGKVYSSIIRLDDNLKKQAKTFAVVKVDGIELKADQMWVSSSPKTLAAKENGTYQVVSCSFMDALCSVILSHIFERKMSPHFPACYLTYVAQAKFSKRHSHEQAKSNSKDKPHYSQVIWMEHLPYSFSDLTKHMHKASRWWTALWQIWAGACVARHYYGFVHNDLHCTNVRVRLVQEDSNIYYESLDHVYLKVPTEGFVFVLIDFGRSSISLDGNRQNLLVSSEFVNKGSCRSMQPDNACIDVVRLVNSIEQDTVVISDPTERTELRSFLKTICETNNGEDLFTKWNTTKSKNDIYYYLDKLPRLICHKYDAQKVLSMPSFYSRFQVDSIPEDIQPFVLPINLRPQ